MSDPIALVTNVCDYAGPPAVAALVDAGFHVVCHDPLFSAKEAQHLYAQKHPQVVATEIQEPKELISFVRSRFSRIDALISNDSYPAIHGPIADADVNDLSKTFDRVVLFPFKLMQAVIPLFQEQRQGNIVLITSCRTELPLPGGAIPDIARAGANALVKSLSLELAPYNVPVNGVAPNYLYSEAYFPKAAFIDNPAGKAFIEEVVPAGRLGRPEEIGELIAYLAGMKGSFHTGTIIKFAGGWPAAPKRPV